MKKYLFLMVMIFAVVIGTPGWAGEMKNDQYNFEIQWPKTMTREPNEEDQTTILVLRNKTKTLHFSLSVCPANSNGEEFLRSDACLPELFKKSEPKIKYLDTMATVGGFPARKFIFQANQEVICGLFQTIARSNHFVFVGAANRKTPAELQSWLEKIVSSFRLTLPGETHAVARVAGSWKCLWNGHPGTMEITGNAGSYNGRFNVDGFWEEMLDLKVTADSILFRRAKADQRFRGSISGNTMSGTFSQAGSGKYTWTSDRLPESNPKNPDISETQKPPSTPKEDEGEDKPLATAKDKGNEEKPAPKDEFGSDF